MFKNPFSLEGRIRRTEYGFTNIIIAFAGTFVFLLGFVFPFLYVAFVPLIWFAFAQTTKRCHDLNKSGWWQLVPFYAFWLLFAPGDVGPNRFGPDPKQTADMPQQMFEEETVVYQETIIQQPVMPEVVVVPVIQTEPVYINSNPIVINNYNESEEDDSNDQYDDSNNQYNNSENEYDNDREEEDN